MNMHLRHVASSALFFFFNDTATTEIYTLSLHDALPICETRPRAAERDHQLAHLGGRFGSETRGREALAGNAPQGGRDRKSTRLNSSHGYISYAVFCLKKKKSRGKPSRAGHARAGLTNAH